MPLNETITVILDPTRAIRGGRRVQGALGNIESSAERMQRRITVGVAALGVSATAAVAVSVREIARLQTSVTEITTLFDSTADSLRSITNTVRDQAAAFGGTATTQAQAYYGIVSSGAMAGAEATLLLNSANTLALAGVTSVAIAADGLTSTLNAYNLEASDAARVSDSLFTAVRLGKTTIDELSASIGGTAPIASQLGVDLDSLLAAVSALTTTGLTTSQSFTQVRSALSSILNPSMQARDLAREIGLEFNTTALRNRGFPGFLDDIREATQGNNEQMATLFGSIEGLQGIMSLTGDQAETFSNNLIELGNSTGAVEIAAEKAANTLEFQFGRVLSNSANLLAALFSGGTDTAVTGLEKLADSLAVLSRNTDTLLIGLGGLIAVINSGRLAGRLSRAADSYSEGLDRATRNLYTVNRAIGRNSASLLNLGASYRAGTISLEQYSEGIVRTEARMASLDRRARILTSSTGALGRFGRTLTSIGSFLSGNALGLAITGLTAIIGYISTIRSDSEVVADINRDIADAAKQIGVEYDDVAVRLRGFREEAEQFSVTAAENLRIGSEQALRGFQETFSGNILTFAVRNFEDSRTELINLFQLVRNFDPVADDAAGRLAELSQAFDAIGEGRSDDFIRRYDNALGAMFRTLLEGNNGLIVAEEVLRKTRDTTAGLSPATEEWATSTIYQTEQVRNQTSALDANNRSLDTTLTTLSGLAQLRSLVPEFRDADALVAAYGVIEEAATVANNAILGRNIPGGIKAALLDNVASVRQAAREQANGVSQLITDIGNALDNADNDFQEAFAGANSTLRGFVPSLSEVDRIANDIALATESAQIRQDELNRAFSAGEISIMSYNAQSGNISGILSRAIGFIDGTTDAIRRQQDALNTAQGAISSYIQNVNINALSPVDQALARDRRVFEERLAEASQFGIDTTQLEIAFERSQAQIRAEFEARSQLTGTINQQTDAQVRLQGVIDSATGGRAALQQQLQDLQTVFDMGSITALEYAVATNSVMEELNNFSIDQVQANMERLEDLVRSGAISWSEYSAGIRQSRMELNNLGAPSDFEAELVRLEDRIMSTGSILGQTFVSAADEVSNAIVNLANTGEFNFRSLGHTIAETALELSTNSLVSDLFLRLGVGGNQQGGGSGGGFLSRIFGGGGSSRVGQGILPGSEGTSLAGTNNIGNVDRVQISNVNSIGTGEASGFGGVLGNLLGDNRAQEVSRPLTNAANSQSGIFGGLFGRNGESSSQGFLNNIFSGSGGGGLLGGLFGSSANGLLSSLGSLFSGGGSSGFLGGLFSIFGFANGGSFMVGGSGGVDSQLVAFAASPNERVTVETPDQQRASNFGMPDLSVATQTNVQIVNNAPGVGFRQERLSNGDVRIIAEEVATAVVRRDADAVIGRNISDPNSRTSRSLATNTQSRRSY